MHRRHAQRRRGFGRHLYFHLWLALLAGLLIVGLAAGLVWRLASPELPREIVLVDEAGKRTGSARLDTRYGEGRPQVRAELDDGRVVFARWSGERWKGPGFLAWLALIVLAVGAGAYPVVRRLTRRLEELEEGVDALGEGDLAARVPVRGHDEIARLAERFNHAAARIETLVGAHKTLLANASHELRSPLARIRMGLEMLGQGGAPASDRAHEEIARSIGELDQLIEEILLASRLDARGAADEALEELDLTALAAEECARSGADLAADGVVTLKGSPRLLRRLIRNLLENARRHAGADSRVEVFLARRGGRVELTVCDRGPGVPEAERERIFEPFYRLRGTSESQGGSGLGLSLVRAIALRHGGGVRCAARAGGGACFEVILADPA
ncbi:MAG: sensor histidine kinase [Burkholderiales bacterium]